MKNRESLFSKKISLICIFILNIVIPVFSFSNFWWNISLNFEGKIGTTDELVYENNKKISLLEWETPFLPAISFRNQLGLSNFIFNINSFPFKNNKEFGLKISCTYEKISCRGVSYFANIGLSSSGLDSEYFSISVGIIFTLI